LRFFLIYFHGNIVTPVKTVQVLLIYVPTLYRSIFFPITIKSKYSYISSLQAKWVQKVDWVKRKRKFNILLPFEESLDFLKCKTNCY